jgi:tetratricopeptide (TPR) repeat protein
MNCYDTALDREPLNPAFAHQRGLLKVSLGKLEDALTDFDTAFSVEPNNPTHLYQRGLILEKLNRNAEAKRTWQIAMSLFKQNHDGARAAECSARIKRLG